jgi:uncharacterized membrane protein YfcA
MITSWLTDPEVLVVSILVLAAFVRGAFGFADALVGMPLLVLLLPTPAASAIMALTSLIMALTILCLEWRQVEVRASGMLVVTGMVGVPLGIWLAMQIDERYVKGFLGTVLVAFSLWSLRTRNPFILKSDRAAPVFGLVAGVLGGAYNTAGPPLVIFATLRQWSPLRLRAFMQVYSVFGSIWLILMHLGAGNITAQTGSTLITAAPIVIIATLTGRRLTARLATQGFVRAIFVLLTLMGLGLIASSFAKST